MTDTIQAQFQLHYAQFNLHVDLNLPAQGVTALYGQSGSGKTTLLRCIAGLERAQQSFLKIGAVVWEDSKQYLRLPTEQRSLGYVFQEANLFPHLSVLQNLHYGRKRNKNLSNPAALAQAVELLGIGHLLKRYPSKLSGGERQRVAIARALAVCPTLLLMDEPLAALDPERKQEILPYLARLTAEFGLPILYVTHAPQEIARLADYLVILEQGKVHSMGTLNQVLGQTDSLPFEQQAFSVLAVRVVAYEADYHLLHVDFGGGRLLLPHKTGLALGELLRLRVYAHDISLVLEQPQFNISSILNILPVQVVEIGDPQYGQVLVKLALGSVMVLAQITQKSLVALRLEVGKKVFAQIKATAIL